MFSGNSAYGRTLVNKECHRDVTYHHLEDTNLNAAVNNKRFYNLDELKSDIIEVEMYKPNIKLDVPIQVGFFVLEYAKLLLLQFYYDCLLRFLPFDSFALIESDTDSMYFSLSEDNLFLAIPVHKRPEFMQQYDNWFAVDYCPDHKEKFFAYMFEQKEWVQQDCCKKVAKHDSRSVGKFHVEWKGDGVIALCSKCYYCIGEETKFSSKGISRRHNQLTEKDYMHVLLNQTITTGTNMGFRVKGGNIFTYTQNRKGLNYMYGKRIVSSNHVTTFPTML